MSTFTSGGDSGSSGTQRDSGLDAEEVGKRLDLDPKVVDWLRTEPAKDDSGPRDIGPSGLLLVLNYQNEFLNKGDFEVNKLTVSNALIGLGATLISDNVFKFDDWKTCYSAKQSMWSSMSWCFFHPHLPTAQLNNISHQPTIITNAITWWSPDTDLTIIPHQSFEL